MSPPSTMSLLARWEDARAQGRDLSAAEVCHDCPEQAERIAPLLDGLRKLSPVIDAAGCSATVYASLHTMPPVPDVPAASARLVGVPGYEIEGELGRGGMGVVFRAQQMGLGRTVALKVILSGEYASGEELARFRAEGEAVAAIGHPGVVQVYELGTHQAASGEELPYLAMEHCGGGNLADRLRGRPMPPAEAAALVEAIARAVQAAHERGIVHRDLKPANVLFGDDGKPRVADFGLARRMGGGGLTATGAVLGTPSYMAPEQARREKGVGPAVDVYALGAILYECLTGRPPFLAATAVDTILQVVTEEPARPRSLYPHIDRDLETICLKCLGKEPGKRYSSAEALAEDLGRCQRGEPVQARPVSAPARWVRWARRRPALVACLVLLLVAVPGAVRLWYWGDQHRRAAATAERERMEIQRVVEGLPPQQQEVIRKFRAWILGRPQLAALTFEEAFALYQQDRPDEVTTNFTVPPEIRKLSAERVAPQMIGD